MRTAASRSSAFVLRWLPVPEAADTRLIPVRTLARALCLGIVALLVLHFAGEHLSPPLHERLDLNAEANVPTWYSTILLFCVALAALGISLADPPAGPGRRFWRFFSAVYCFLSLDEAARIHELADQVLWIKWIYVYAPLGAAFFVFCVRSLATMDNVAARERIVFGLLLFGLGGLGGETLSYLLRPLPDAWQQAEFVFEEGLEMLGSVIVLAGCLLEADRLLARRAA